MSAKEIRLIAGRHCLVGTRYPPGVAPSPAEILWCDDEWAVYRWDGSDSPCCDKWDDLKILPLYAEEYRKPSPVSEEGAAHAGYRPRASEKCLAKLKDDSEFYSVRVFWITDTYAALKFAPDRVDIFSRDEVEFMPLNGRKDPEPSPVSLWMDMYVDCPHCGATVDLMCLEEEGEFSSVIFSCNAWTGKLRGMKVLCPGCCEPVILGEIEW